MTEINKNEPVVSDTEMKMPEEPFGATKQSMAGPIIGLLVVLLVLILGGLYLWGAALQNNGLTTEDRATRPTAEENNEPETNNADAQVQALQTVSTSDEIGAIDADVESTNLDELDAELNAIDAEMEAGSSAQ